MLCRGGKYTEEDAKAVMLQILNVVSFCHLQGVVHRDLKPEVHICLFLIDIFMFSLPGLLGKQLFKCLEILKLYEVGSSCNDYLHF